MFIVEYLVGLHGYGNVYTHLKVHSSWFFWYHTFNDTVIIYSIINLIFWKVDFLLLYYQRKGNAFCSKKYLWEKIMVKACLNSFTSFVLHAR